MQDSLKTLKRLRWKWLWLWRHMKRGVCDVWCERVVAQKVNEDMKAISELRTLMNISFTTSLDIFSWKEFQDEMWKSISKAKKDITFGQIALITRVSNHWLNICVGISINVFSFKIILILEAQIAECKCFSRPVNTQLVEIGVDD